MNNNNQNGQNNKTSIKAILTLSAFILIICGAFLLNLIMPTPDVLQSERRVPAVFPKISVKTIQSSEFMNGFSKYATDNFILRDGFRIIRAVCVFDVFMQSDKSGLYYDSKTGAGKFEKVNEDSFIKAADKIKKLCDFFPGLDIYYAVVPDKSIYAKRYYPGFEPEKAYKILSENLTGIKFIDLTDALKGEDFYKTDIHWDQAKIYGVLDTLSDAMGFAGRLDKDFNQNIAGTFHGVYTGQIALPLEQDTMTYLTNDIINNAIVNYFNPKMDSWEQGSMYEIKSVNGRDPYDLFLKGVQPLIIIENPSASTTRQLYLFRDSFSSSLAPLLTSAYAKITIIDMRYIDSRVLENYITFERENADILFLYSSQILNNPNMLLVN